MIGTLLSIDEVCSCRGRTPRAATVFRDTLHRRLQPLRYLHSCSGCFRLERLPGGICTHWESAALTRRTPSAAISQLLKSPRWAGFIVQAWRLRRIMPSPNKPAPEPWTDPSVVVPAALGNRRNL